MAKMTDYVREGFKRRRRPWDRTELPEWWDLVVWAGLVGVAASLVLGALLARGESADDATGDSADSPGYPAQSINPYAPSSAPTPSASAAPAPSGPAGNAAGASARDFASTAAVEVGLTGGAGTTVVPAGARNVALAAAMAEATGDWTGIPFIGTTRPPEAAKTPRGSVVGGITVADPSVTGNGRYLFTAMIRHDSAARPFRIEITVGRGQSGYAAWPRRQAPRGG